MDQSQPLDDDLGRVYAGLRSVAYAGLSVSEAVNMASAMGINPAFFSNAFDQRSGMGSRAKLWPVIDRCFNDLNLDRKRDALCAMASILVNHRRTELRSAVEATLANLGYRFEDGVFSALS